jgi:hypothetical protein
VQPVQSGGPHAQTNSQKLARWIVGGVFLVALIGVMFFVWDYRVKAGGKSHFAMAQMESHDCGSQMVNYTKQGRYEDAIQVGLHALQISQAMRSSMRG